MLIKATGNIGSRILKEAASCVHGETAAARREGGAPLPRAVQAIIDGVREAGARRPFERAR